MGELTPLKKWRDCLSFWFCLFSLVFDFLKKFDFLLGKVSRAEGRCEGTWREVELQCLMCKSKTAKEIEKNVEIEGPSWYL